MTNKVALKPRPFEIGDEVEVIDGYLKGLRGFILWVYVAEYDGYSNMFGLDGMQINVNEYIRYQGLPAEQLKLIRRARK